MKGELSWRHLQWYRQFHSEAFSPVFVDKAGLFVVKLNMMLKCQNDDFSFTWYINSLSLIVTEFAYLVVGSKKESIVADRLFFVIFVSLMGYS